MDNAWFTNLKLLYVCLTVFSLLVAIRIYNYETTIGVNIVDVEGDIPEPITSQKREGFGLYVRMFHKKAYLYDALLVKSLQYFWPQERVPLTVVLDDERREDHRLGNEISTRFPYPSVRYEKQVDPKLYGIHGHYRMQRNMFYAEKYCDYKYVGFVDTDTFFVTPVTPDLLFENGKPIVIGQYGKAANFFWSDVGKGTKIMFKEPEVMRCMSYFPVIIKVEHLILLRKHVERIHKRPFDKVFPRIVGGSRFSQFNLMCQYIWNYHRDEYSFHMQLRSVDGEWQGEGNSPHRHTFDYYNDIIDQNLTKPIPRSSIHYRYHANFKNVKTYRNLFLEGICHSGGFTLCKNVCRSFNKNRVQRPLFQFEGSDWIWDTRCLDAQRQHYNIVKKDLTDEHKNRIKMACKEVRSLKFNFTR